LAAAFRRRPDSLEDEALPVKMQKLARIAKFSHFLYTPAIGNNSPEKLRSRPVATERQTADQKNYQRILAALTDNPKLSRRELAGILGLPISRVQSQLNILKKKGVIHRIGPDKGGHWETVENEGG